MRGKRISAEILQGLHFGRLVMCNGTRYRWSVPVAAALLLCCSTAHGEGSPRQPKHAQPSLRWATRDLASVTFITWLTPPSPSLLVLLLCHIQSLVDSFVYFDEHGVVLRWRWYPQGCVRYGASRAPLSLHLMKVIATTRLKSAFLGSWLALDRCSSISP